MYAGVADIVGGLQFTDGDLTGLTVADAFFDFDGDRQNRVRYDTPVFGPGLQFSTSAGSDQRYDASLNWGGDFDQWTGWRSGRSRRSLRSASPTRARTASTTGSWAPDGPAQPDRAQSHRLQRHGPGDEGDPYNLYGKLGWYGTLNTLGNTGLRRLHPGHDVSADGDDGYSVGGAVVQTIEGYGTELYSQVRWYTLDGNDPSVDDIVVGTLGHAGEVLMRSWHKGSAWVARARPGERLRADPAGRPAEKQHRDPAGPGLFTGEAGELVIFRR